MKSFATLVLVCALSGTALAGDVPSTGIVPPPPETVQSETPNTDVTLPGEIPTSGLSLLLTALGLVF